VEILLALGAAISYGASDFTGGFISKRAAVFLVVLVSQIVSLAVLLAVLPFWAGNYSREAIGWGATAGVAGVAGASALYRGLSVGRMSVVAPISGVLAAGIPVLVGLWLGERPGPLALIGVAVGLMAVVAVSRTPDPRVPAGSTSPEEHRGSGPRGSGRGVLEGLGAGIGFGLFFVLLERSPTDSGLWPLVGTRASMIALVASVVTIGGLSRALPGGLLLRLCWLGFINVLADLLYLLATRHGLLSLVAVITSMYPAVTVILARSMLREAMVKQQVVGLGLAAASVVLIALG
jgi:drug/metabolite transporter (DMT)-like permease